MKKLLTLATIATIACAVLVATSAFAAEETITITATVSGVQGVSLSSTSWVIGAVSAGESRSSSSITAENTGSVTETLEMSAASTGDFALGSTAGDDQIAIWGKCASSDPGLTVANALSGTSGQRSENVDPTSDLTVYMKYSAPTSITSGNSDGTASVTVSTMPAQ